VSGEEEAIGKSLADPTGILKRGVQEEGLRSALVKCCESSSAASTTTSGTSGGLFGGTSAFGGSLGQTNQQQQQQQQQVVITLHSKPTAITPSISKDVLLLSNELHLSIAESVALFAETNALILGNEGDGDTIMERKAIDDDFVESLICSGRIGFEEDGGEKVSASSSKATKKQEDVSAVVHMARHLFFHERAALLYTILDLIRHRIQAADETSATGNPIIVATDQLLQAGLVVNLINAIRELNDMTREIRGGLKRVHDERKEREKRSGMMGGFAATPAASEQNLDMEFALLGFTQMQRHLAAECLFYLAYHTQLTSEEVASLIDLIKDLTNGNGSTDEGLPLLNPLDPLMQDVPSPYEEADSMSAFNTWQQQQNYGMGGWSKPIPSKAKDSKQWEKELTNNLWGRGQPQLLQCVSTLIMSVLCALDARHVLLERSCHGPNPFGEGNALMPPMREDVQSSMGGLQAIHSRLDPESQDVENQWKRHDIWGLLLVPYALLLRNATGTQLRSPGRSGGSRSSPGRSPPVRVGQLNIKSTYTKCLMVASQLKALTFARMSVIPCFDVSSVSKLEHYMDSSIGDFYVSVFADFTAQFIDALCATGNLPITRKEWYDEEFNMAQTEWAEKEQRRQFGLWAGQDVKEDTGGPREVNIMDRPDCLEDIFALVSSICSTHPEGSRAFWKTAELQEFDEDGSPLPPVACLLAPSRFLERLDLIHSDSDSLLFVYLSFLSSLALADGTDEAEATNGATTIHSFLCGDRTINPHSERHVPFGWTNVINAIRWYSEQLSPEEGEKKKSPADRLRQTSSTVDTSEPSTSYYYGVSSNGDSNATSSSPNQGQGRASTPDDKNEGLDEVSTNILIALLCLISNVAARSSTAREHILGLQLPVQRSSASNETYQESSLEILFSLLTTPISPELQGMTMMAIANLLQPTPSSSEDTTRLQPGKRAWELLEMIQLIPIKLLENGSIPGTVTLSSFGTRGRNQVRDGSFFFSSLSFFNLSFNLLLLPYNRMPMQTSSRIASFRHQQITG
jgi:hypothetical protein